MSAFDQIGEAAKSIFSFSWLKGAGNWLEKASAHFAGETASELMTNFGKEAGKVLLNNIFRVPPRPELENFLLNLDDNDRKKIEERLSEAKDDPQTPMENDVVSALCWLLTLQKEKIVLTKKDGEPILDKEGKVRYLNKPGLSKKELLEIFSKLAKMKKNEFWIWIDLLIHDPWRQKFLVVRQLTSQSWEVVKKWLRKQAKEATLAQKDFEQKIIERINNRKTKKVKTGIIGNLKLVFSRR